MTTGQPDPYTALGLQPDASAAEITAAYRRAVRACHPDMPHPDLDRLATVVAAYQQLRDRNDHDHPDDHDVQQRTGHGQLGDTQGGAGHRIPVCVHPDHAQPPTPELRVGPVRHHPRPG